MTRIGRASFNWTEALTIDIPCDSPARRYHDNQIAVHDLNLVHDFSTWACVSQNSVTRPIRIPNGHAHRLHVCGRLSEVRLAGVTSMVSIIRGSATAFASLIRIQQPRT